MVRAFWKFGALVLTSLTVNATFAAQLVVNGGFETGNFNGWILSGNTTNTGVDSLAPHSGMFSAFLGPSSLGFLDQVLPTAAGSSYELTFFLQSDGDTPNEFRAQINSTILFDSINIPLQPYTPHIFDFVATGSSTDLKFGFRNDPGFLRLDDISVNSLAGPVPEPSSVLLVGVGLLFGSLFFSRMRKRHLKILDMPRAMMYNRS